MFAWQAKTNCFASRAGWSVFSLVLLSSLENEIQKPTCVQFDNNRWMTTLPIDHTTPPLTLFQVLQVQWPLTPSVNKNTVHKLMYINERKSICKMHILYIYIIIMIMICVLIFIMCRKCNDKKMLLFLSLHTVNRFTVSSKVFHLNTGLQQRCSTKCKMLFSAGNRFCLLGFWLQPC